MLLVASVVLNREFGPPVSLAASLCKVAGDGGLAMVSDDVGERSIRPGQPNPDVSYQCGRPESVSQDPALFGGGGPAAR
jgi:hypothetical protein